MISLILSILSSTLILLIFKHAERIKIDIFQIIVINYFVASVLGFFLTDIKFSGLSNYSYSWIYMSMIIGFLFIIMFFVIGISTQKAGMSVTAIAGKMSVVLPISFSILYYNEEMSNIKVAAIILALLSVALTVYKKRKKELELRYVILPIVLFIGIGIIDSLVKMSQEEFVDNKLVPLFSGACFTMAFISGIVLTIIKKVPVSKFLNLKILITGILLGVANFGSIYFLIRALNSGVLDSSIVFAINNIGIIILTLIFALIIYSERISKLNWIGVILSFITIGLLAIA